MKSGVSVPPRKPDHGFALVLVLGFLVLLTVLVVAFFTSVTTDYSSSKQYSNGAATKQLADSVVQVAMGQIKLATAGTNPTTGGMVAWASQPGMIRTYDDAGTELTNYKLYSSSAMTTAGPLSLSQVSDYDTAWRTKTAAWTDLNAPVTDATGTVNFPIIDGNKMVSLTLPGDTSASLTYDGTNNASGGATPDGIPDVQGFSVKPNGPLTYDPSQPLSPKNTPVPMPVTWLYQLADGSLIAPDASSTATATFTGVPTAQQPTGSNPIVGRVAFWTDDETSKLNINTACGDEWTPAQVTPGATPGPTPAGTTPYTAPGASWDVPRAYTGYEYNNLALVQPVQHEYQRYPGHPASLYLSAVLPGMTRDQIFSLVPRISAGGSEGGTTLASTTLTPDTDRLYASIDELLFTPSVANNARTLSDNSRTFLTRASLERAKFFLTANSRAPEVNLFNKPRIAVWPVDQDVITQAVNGVQSPRGTAFDNLIAFCAHLGPLGSGNDYIFQRSLNGYLSATKDYDLTTGGMQRNHLLYSYLQNLASLPIPGFGGTLANKFGADTNQILTEVFDYVRCVNPSDDNIAFLSHDGTGSPTNDANCYTPAEQYTTSILAGGYTGSPILNPKPYHALIVPTKIGSTQGFGRTVTLSEVGLAFICNADGTSTATNPLFVAAVGPTAGDGGLSTLTPATATPPSTPIFSDFPPLKTPLPTQAQITAHPFFKNAPGYKVAGTFGFDKTNWNGNLPLYDWAADTTGTLWTGLRPGQRRVQAILLLNPYTVSPGYSTMHMDIGFQVSGLSGIGAAGLNSINFPDGKTVVMSNPTYRTPTFGVNFPFFYNSYLAPGRVLVDAPAASPTQSDGDITTPSVGLRYPPYRTYEFVSSPFTVTVNAANTMPVTSVKPVTISIWHLCPADEAQQSLGNPATASTMVQTLNLDFGTLAGAWQIPTLYAPLPSPTLPAPPSPGTDSSIINTGNNPSVEWDFSWAGAFPYAATLTRGRFYDSVGNGGHYFEPAFIANDVVKTMVPGYPTDAVGPSGDYRLVAAQSSLTGAFVPHRLTVDTTTGTNPAPYVNSPAFKHSFPMLFRNGQVLTFEEQMDVGQTTASGAYTVGSNVSQAPFAALVTSIPPNAAFANSVNNLVPVKTGDYDNGLGSDMDGPFINKPDTGYNYNPGSNTYPYFGMFAENSTAGFFSPNRQIPSPGMFGSLPVGVVRKMPWQTLLFRPQPTHPDGVPVPDAGLTSVPPSPYGAQPADHLIMDWFWMPVVEPYAISEPFSTAGKVNMNYQIAPFTYITRATALDALLKSQRMLAIPNNAPSQYWKQPLYYDANPNTAQGGYLPGGADYRANLNLSNTNGTLRQFEETFGAGDLFRSPTQICDIYLTPQGQNWSRNSDAAAYWTAHQLTGDNSRERPYANLYGCLTTKSNTFTVHFRVQSLQKVPGTPVAQWVDGRDVVVGDTRGSTLIERYVDSSDTSLPDFTTSTTAVLDKYYKFRVVSTRKFAP